MSSDSTFAGSIPELYDTVLVPMVFLDYAEDVANLVAAGLPADVLETAAGTGAVTRVVHRLLPEARLTATDLNAAMLTRAAEVLPASPLVTWQVANAQALPYDDATFDAVVCQFGAMFFPDRQMAYAEALRVLRPGGRFVLATWGTSEDNEIVLFVEDALRQLFPDDPPLFFRRMPFGYTDVEQIRADLAAAGFGAIEIRAVEHRNAPTSAHDIAVAHCQGTPMSNALTERGADLGEVTDQVTRLLERRIGTKPYAGRIMANIATAAA